MKIKHRMRLKGPVDARGNEKGKDYLHNLNIDERKYYSGS
jgi:hypothetical protein